jgi:hypothetical protein
MIGTDQMIREGWKSMGEMKQRIPVPILEIVRFG